ncbi:ATP-binding protein [Patescibacteria group bacterium]|uniref:Putative ATPase domain containing protein n=1 Tax=viral metagenome TaxID=1070528 RepID=A0A6M3KR54_9ZZZZ|nr:ATP-binding protein [Patescibacteria group bacterium]
MFDPGGEKVLREQIESGLVFPNTDPIFGGWTAFAEEVARLYVGGFFNQIGTLAIDSLTTMSQSAMEHILQKGGRSGGVPQRDDYLKQQMILKSILYDQTKKDFKGLCSLSCNFITTAHLETEKDDVTGRIKANPIVTGKLKTSIPLLFDEVYVCTTKPGPKGTEYRLLTQNEGYYKARTRIGAYKFEMYEDPNITKLLEKSGIIEKPEEQKQPSKQEETKDGNVC